MAAKQAQRWAGLQAAAMLTCMPQQVVLVLCSTSLMCSTAAGCDTALLGQVAVPAATAQCPAGCSEFRSLVLAPAVVGAIQTWGQPYGPWGVYRW